MEGGVLWILGKGRDEREPVTVPRPSRVALARWIEQRGAEPGPFFLSRDRAGKGDGRLTGRGIDQMIKKVGRQLGMVKIRYHGLRHAAITDALVATNGDVALVQQFSRHGDPRTVMIYRDNTQDDFGRIAELVAGRTVTPPDEES
jgi:integrase/recombinase XerC